MKRSSRDTSWENSSDWYQQTVGAEGHYYHRQSVLPGTLKLLQLKKQDALLDLACGQGVLARQLPKGVSYLGLDASSSLIRNAERTRSDPAHQFEVRDLSHPVGLTPGSFTHATCLLAVQNLETPLVLFQTAAQALRLGGKFVIVLNHPCFRIPRQSHWGVDPQKKLQYRRLDLYMSPLKIPIQTHPSQEIRSPTTWSFHRPLSAYSGWLKEAGFSISSIEEWCSDKVSTGKMASMENRSRREFPLFLALLAEKSH